jgi:hypothetical protein
VLLRYTSQGTPRKWEISTAQVMHISSYPDLSTRTIVLRDATQCNNKHQANNKTKRPLPRRKSKKNMTINKIKAYIHPQGYLSPFIRPVQKLRFSSSSSSSVHISPLSSQSLYVQRGIMRNLIRTVFRVSVFIRASFVGMSGAF